MNRPDDPAKASEAASTHGGDIMRGIGLYLSNVTVYGPQHQVTKDALEGIFQLISRRLESAEEILFTVNHNRLLVDGVEVDTKNPVLARLVNQMVAMSLTGFSLQRGTTVEEFGGLLALIGSKPGNVESSGGLAHVMAQRGLRHVRAKTVTYQAVSEDEVVISKDAAAGGGGPGTGAGEGTKGPTAAEQLKEYFKAAGGGAQGVAGALHEALSDPPQLAHVILETAQGGVLGLSGEPTVTLPEAIVACLERAYEGLRLDPAAKTPTGKKSLARTLQLLQSALLDELRKATGQPDLALDDAVSEAMEEMTDELQVDALTSEYLKKRTAIDKSEKRLLKLLRAAGKSAEDLIALHERLTEAGLPEDRWSELLTRVQIDGGIGLPPGSAAGVMVDGGVFSGLIARLSERLRALETMEKGKSVDDLQEVMAQLDHELEGLVTRVERKIQTLSLTEAEKQEEANPADETVRRFTSERRRRMALIAEIAQEFCQPLSVMHSSIDMVRQCRAGTITDQQGALLSMASHSGARLNSLIGELMEICGMPATLTPDRCETAIPGAPADQKSS